MKSIQLRIWLIAGVVLFLSCSQSSTEKQPEEETNPPSKAIGLLPLNGEPCSDYSPVFGDDSKVAILIQWNTAQEAEQYRLVMWEEGSQVLSQTTNSLELEVEVQRGRTYMWAVTAINSYGETSGDTYSFTTPGVPVGNYAPYAAEIVAEFDAISLEISISWTGKDEDGDPLLYNVRVTEEGQTIEELLESEATSLDPIPYGSGLEYWVEVISKDGAGNFSVSQWTGTAPN
jgi:hypothetical protein